MVAGLLPREALNDDQCVAWAVSEPLINELREADTILLGAPMYNYSIPSVLKVWFDRVTVKEHMIGGPTSEGLLTGKRTVVVTARGGAYGPGTPRERYDFQTPYHRALLEQIGLDRNLEFVHSEMTLAHSVPSLEQFKPIADASREEAVKAVRRLALASRKIPSGRTPPGRHTGSHNRGYAPRHDLRKVHKRPTSLTAKRDLGG